MLWEQSLGGQHSMLLVQGRSHLTNQTNRYMCERPIKKAKELAARLVPERQLNCCLVSLEINPALVSAGRFRPGLDRWLSS